MGSWTNTSGATAPGIAAPIRAKPPFIASLVHILTGQFACGSIALLTEIAYARILGPEARGVISLCLMSVAFASLIGGLGGEGSIIYWSSRAKRNHSAWLPAVLLWGLLGSTSAMVAWTLAYWHFHLSVLRGITPASAWLVLATVPVAIFFAYLMAFLAGIEEFRLRSAGAFLRQLAGIFGCLILLGVIGRTPEAAVGGFLVGLLAASGASVWLVRRELAGFWRLRTAAQNLKPTLVYGLRGYIGNLATFFTYRFDVFVVNYFLQPAQVGFYALGVAISESLWQIPQAVASALFPRTSRTQEMNQAESTRFTCFVLRQVFFLTLLCGILVAAISPIAIPIVFGTGFNPSVAVVLWILPGTIALSMGKVACADLAGRGKNGYSSIFALICFAITIGLDWVLIPRLGILGAALASSVAYCIDAVFILIAVRYELKVTWKDLFLPTRQEIASYRTALNRFNTSVRGENSIRPRVSSTGDR
jgi:O-antigen/teichoic acid export membrane protein